MVGVNFARDSAPAAAAGTDTVIVTPAPGQKIKVIAFHATNKGTIGAAAHILELRYGTPVTGSFKIAEVGWDSAAPPIGFMSKPAIVNQEIICNGIDSLLGRNVVVLAAGQIAEYDVAAEVMT